MEVTDSILIQLFDFTMFSPGKFSGWSIGEQNTEKINDKLIYKYKIDPFAAFYRGIQIIDPSRSRATIFASIRDSDFNVDSNQHVSYIAHDFRNNSILKISTNREETTNYFHTENNSLPFELSPAFFHPEVLAKYKFDQDKYTVKEHEISCRATWSLRYGTNDANQVFAFIRDLRYLPFSEKKYWASFNETPKAGLPEHVVRRYFSDEPTNHVTPLEKIRLIIRCWDNKDFDWWQIRDQRLLIGINTPYTSSRDEWARAFIELSKLIIEGFVPAELRRRLNQLDIEYKTTDKSIFLMEKLLSGSSNIQDNQRLKGLRSIQEIRSKGGIAHTSVKTAALLSNDALQNHGSYTNHFNAVCETTAMELLKIERLLNIDS